MLSSLKMEEASCVAREQNHLDCFVSCKVGVGRRDWDLPIDHSGAPSAPCLEAARWSQCPKPPGLDVALRPLLGPPFPVCSRECCCTPSSAISHVQICTGALCKIICKECQGKYGYDNTIVLHKSSNWHD